MLAVSATENDRREVRHEKGDYFTLNSIPVFLDISIKSSTTDLSSGIPSLLRIASASLSGSPGISGPVVPGAGLVLRKTWIQSSICFLNSSLSMKPSICMAPKKWPMPLPTLRSGISHAERYTGWKRVSFTPIIAIIRSWVNRIKKDEETSDQSRTTSTGLLQRAGFVVVRQRGSHIRL